MSGSGETDNRSKYEKGTTPASHRGEKGKETNTWNRRENQSHSRMELVQVYIPNKDFKGDTP